MKRRQWLRNDFDAKLVNANTFVIEEDPVVLVATGLALTDAIAIEVRGDATTTLQAGGDYFWAPYYRNGVKIELRGDNNQIVLIVPGVYRIVGGPAVGAVTVSLHEGEKINDDRIIFNDISNAIMAAVVQPAAAVCPSSPVADMDFFHVQRCDATTKEPVTLVFSVSKANNDVCPPAPAGAMALLGFIAADGVFVAGAYPGTLGSCGCAAAVPLGELSSWG